MDGDGDLDVLSASFNDNKIAWYENLAGDGSFGDAPQVHHLATTADRRKSVAQPTLTATGTSTLGVSAIVETRRQDRQWYENHDNDDVDGVGVCRHCPGRGQLGARLTSPC